VSTTAINANDHTAATSVADLLKSETADAHHRAETHPVQKAFASGTIATADLAALFHRLHGLLSEVERRHETESATHPGLLALREDATPHRDRLAHDLAGLDPRSEQAAASPAVARFVERLGGERWHPAAIAGAFYVLEGSMNGNRFIRMGLERHRPDLTPHLSYLDPYGDEQRARWQATRARLDAVAPCETSRRIMLDAAHATFDCVAALSEEVLEAHTRRTASTTVETKPSPRCPVTGHG
jgi:heme oxygenase